MKDNLLKEETDMKEYVKAFCGGYVNAWRYNMRRIKETKWYIIPTVINTLLSPLIVIIMLLMCLTKGGRGLVLLIGRSILEEKG